jgi:hypothetical protein
MAELASRILVLIVVASCFWILLLWPLRRIGEPLGGLVAALLSWGGASLAAGWVVTVLHRVGLWPLV